MKTVLPPLVAAVITAIVAYLTRGRRLPRIGHWLTRMFLIVIRAVWENTKVVVYVAILVGIGVNVWQSIVLAGEIRITTSAACSYLEDLKVRYESNQTQLSHAREFGLSNLAIMDLERKIRVQRQAVVALSSLGCR